MKMGPKEAAQRIAKNLTSTTMDPNDQHAVKYLQDVADALGAEKSPQNIQRIADLLREADIEIHRGDEFPKYITSIGDVALIADNAQEQDELCKKYGLVEKDGKFVTGEAPAEPVPDETKEMPHEDA